MKKIPDIRSSDFFQISITNNFNLVKTLPNEAKKGIHRKLFYKGEHNANIKTWQKSKEKGKLQGNLTLKYRYKNPRKSNIHNKCVYVSNL